MAWPSATSLSGAAHVTASLSTHLSAAVLKIIAIVFGVTEAAARADVLDRWSATVAAPRRWR